MHIVARQETLQYGLDVENGRAVDGIEAFDLNGVAVDADQLAGGDADAVRAVLAALGEDADLGPDRVLAGVFAAEDRGLVDGLVENVAANYISHLQENPNLLDGVVAGAADRFMESVRADPSEVNQLVQVVGDMYLEYLRVYPDNVQDLLAGQTVSITNDVVAEVRKRSASGDARLETALRNLLRLKPRDDKPLPDIEPLV